MTLLDLGYALMTVGVPVYHLEAHEQTDQYIVYAEDGQADSLWADGKMQEQAIQGTVDYFTRKEFDKNVKKIQKAFNDAGISWRLNSIQYEDDTRLTHYEWVWEIPQVVE